MDGFITTYVWPGAIILAQSLLVLVALLLFIAYILYADRKIWAAVQLRRGPNVVGPWGLFQSFADLLKFVFKEPVIPSGANKAVFLLAPLVAVTLALAAWAVIPFDAGWVIADINVGILFVFAISSLEVYAIIMGGWASNSKYPFLGALRSAAQMVSYEVSIGFVIVAVLLCVGSLNLTDIVMAQADGIGTRMGLPNSLFDWHWFALFPLFIIFFISALAETNRPPFDLPEAESELVAGFMVEYGSTPYMMFMLGEYAAIVLMCALTTILFLGGWLPPLDVWFLNWVPGHRLVRAQGQPRVLHVLHGQGLRAALPLRPADAAWLESVPADFAGHAGDRGLRSQADGNRAVILTTCFSIRLIKPSKSGD
jgi:NADH-quinone oxidoreductase subunit H